MNIEKLMIQTVKDLFVKKNIPIDPFNYMIEIYLEIISENYSLDMVWDDIDDYDKMVDQTIDDIEIINHERYIPDHYEEVIDWMEKKGRYIDFSISEKYKKIGGIIAVKRNRVIVRVKDNGLENLLKWCGISYEVNPDLEVEQEECKEEAWEAWKQAFDDEKDKEEMRRNSYRW